MIVSSKTACACLCLRPQPPLEGPREPGECVRRNLLGLICGLLTFALFFVAAAAAATPTRSRTKRAGPFSLKSVVIEEQVGHITSTVSERLEPYTGEPQPLGNV